MNLSTKKISVGIVGSSFSTGRREYNYTFDELFSKLEPDWSFYNLACGGKGSEKYLQSVVRLKEQHDIDCLLMELCYNRASINFPLSANYNRRLDYGSHYNLEWLLNDYYQPQGYQEWEVHLQHDDGVFALWQERPFIRNMTWGEQSKKLGIVSGIRDVQKWQKVQIEIASNYRMRQTLAVIDYQSVASLCRQLDIKLVSWSHNSNNYFSIKIFNDLLPDLNRVKFGDHDTARDHYENTYNCNVLCDGCHFTQQIDAEMVKDHLLPAIKSMVLQNK